MANTWITETENNMAELEITQEDITERFPLRNNLHNFQGFQENSRKKKQEPSELRKGEKSIDQYIIVFYPRAGISLQHHNSPLYLLLSLTFCIFIQFICHNVVCLLVPSSAANFLPVYHSF